MEILKRFLLISRPKPITEETDVCRKKTSEYQQDQQEVRSRIEKMTQDLRQATLNGEERWFLMPHKEDKDGRSPA